MRARGLLSFIALTTAFVVVPSDAAIREIRMDGCKFVPAVRYIDPGDTVTFRYDEGTCYPANHRVKTYGSPPLGFDSSPTCDTAFSADSSCMNGTPGKKLTFSVTLSDAGTYNFYCPFHADPPAGQCSMCGQIIVQKPASTQTTPPASTPPQSVKATTSTSASPTGSATATVSPAATASVSVTPTASASVVAQRDTKGGGGGRFWFALAAIVLLGTLGFLVWRAFLAQRA